MSMTPVASRFRCSCATEELVAEWEPETHVFYFAIWYRGGYQVTGWRFRLRSIWHTLRYGTPYSDELVLSRTDAINMAAFLNRVTGSAAVGTGGYAEDL